MSTQNDVAARQAYDLVKTALQSGVIKLKGVDNTDYASHNGSADADYLLSLIKDLAAGLRKE